MSETLHERATLAIWREEVLRLVALLCLSLVIGMAVDQPMLCIGIGISSYALWHLWQAFRLVSWFKSRGQEEVPEASGIWGEVFGSLYQHQQRNHKDKRRLAAMIDEFQASTAALPDGVVVIDPYGCISWCNESAKELLGLQMPNDLGQRIINLLRAPVFVDYLNRREYDDEIVITSPDDDALILSIRIVPYGEGQRLMLARDISRMHQMERIRRDFVANASHELRTPLTVISGYLDMMEEESAEARPLQPWHAPLSEMRQQAHRMGRIIEDLLKLARIEGNSSQRKQEVTDVPQLIKVILDEAQALSAGRHRFHTDCDEQLLLFGNPVELQSVISNLIFNAIHYTPDAGEITISWLSDHQGAHLTVADTGIGIEPKHIPRLTERFYRVDAGRSRATGGTGLGLSIVKHALEHHDGSLSITSELNHGTTFSCRFPISRVRSRNVAA